MRKIKMIVGSFICMTLIIVYNFSNHNDRDYSVMIQTFTENGSYVEYPQIKGLKDKRKQTSINAILKEQIYIGAKDYEYETFVGFSNPAYVYEFEIKEGFINKDIASFLYSFDANGFFDPDNNWIQNNSRSYGVTIDMETGKKIELPDFMVIDGRLIDSTDGSNLETDYNDIAYYKFHKFKDLYWVYTTEEEKDFFHRYTPQKAVDQLNNPKAETIWYIDENKNIVFCGLRGYMEIPYNELAGIIYPRYLEMLDKE